MARVYIDKMEARMLIGVSMVVKDISVKGSQAIKRAFHYHDDFTYGNLDSEIVTILEEIDSVVSLGLASSAAILMDANVIGIGEYVVAMDSLLEKIEQNKMNKENAKQWEVA